MLLKTSLRVVASQLPLLRSTSQESREFILQSVFSSEVAKIHSSCILSFDLIGRHQNKRLNVTEIILPLGFADVTFLVGPKATTENTSVSAG